MHSSTGAFLSSCNRCDDGVGVLEGDSLEELNFQDMTRQFQVNAVGPLRAVQALLPRLGSDSKVRNFYS